ncbi:BCCT family transporter, partial [Serratia marcescens]|nr:BCCT family transporter [Serratia marcescens]
MSEKDTPLKKPQSHINKAVFFTSAVLIFLLVAFAAFFPDVADKNFKLLQQQIFTNASWFYILAVALILLSVTFLGLSRYGDIKLGPDHAQPDFRYHSWFAMLFSAGMGIGLMFFGVAEPVMHYLSPPVGTPE